MSEVFPKNRPVSYRMSQAAQSQILEHLNACDEQFHPPLSQRVDLPDYASKLHSRAVTFEAWGGDQLVGLVAAYLNHESAPTTAFVSSVSVLSDYRSRGIGRHLLTDCHREARNRGIQKVSLEVSPASRHAIDLYLNLGYCVATEHDNHLLMTLDLGSY